MFDLMLCYVKIKIDPHTSLGRLCVIEQHGISLNNRIESKGQWEGPEYQDTADSGKKKETKAFTFYLMETEEYEKNMISNEFVVKLCLNYEEKDGGKVVKRELLAMGIVDFGNGILTIYHDLISFDDKSDDELEAILASVDVSDLPPLDITDIPSFVCNMGKILRNKKRPCKNYKMTYDGEGLSLTIH
nr:hypothetical protein [Tanacetum cinerariifolium]